MIRCKLNISGLGSVHLFKCMVLVVFCQMHFLSNAQTKDTTTISLNEVEISSVKPKQFKTTKKQQLFDSLTRQNFIQNSIADLISVNSSVFIRNYGPAALSSASLRGGNSSQSPVLWNGFNIQNPMLGQNDFSQLPVFIFDQAGVEYGGSAATWGSGAMGGSIHLNNLPTFNKGFSSSIQMGLGSFDTRKLNTLIHYSTAKISSNTKVYYINSANDFDFVDTIKKKMVHADYTVKGFLQELGFH